MVQGALPGDSGLWTCEVGGRGEGGMWAMAGEVAIRVVREDQGEREGLTGAIQVMSAHYPHSSGVFAVTQGVFQANTTLLAICVVVFLIFLTILLAVAIFFGRSRVSKNPKKDKKIQIEAKSSGEFTLLRKKVLPHIIRFTEKSSVLL